MHIQRLSVFAVELTVGDGAFRLSNNRAEECISSTVVRLQTDDGLVGWGEVCPLGASYAPAYTEGVRAGIARLASAVLGADPREPAVVGARMDAALMGHPYAKAAIDCACWDLLGHDTELPVATLLGGTFGVDLPVYRAVSQASPDVMAEAVARYRRDGYRRFQLKVGGEPAEDIARIRAVSEVLESDDLLIADANGGWQSHQAIRVARAVSDIDLYIEQPCRTYEQCLTVRRAIPQPMILDESIDSVSAILRAHADGALDVASLKLSKFGGITAMRTARDLCIALGIPMVQEDPWGSDIATAILASVAQSTPEHLRFNCMDFNGYGPVRTAVGAPERVGGRLQLASGAGFGITVIEDHLSTLFEVVAT